MAVCPFCSTDADWPYNIVVVYVNGSVDALLLQTRSDRTGDPGSWRLYGWGYGLCEPGSPLLMPPWNRRSICSKLPIWSIAILTEEDSWKLPFRTPI